MGLAEYDLILFRWPSSKIKTGLHPLFIPNIPLFHYSTIPKVK
jgi:hypothetical protein